MSLAVTILVITFIHYADLVNKVVEPGFLSSAHRNFKIESNAVCTNCHIENNFGIRQMFHKAFESDEVTSFERSFHEGSCLHCHENNLENMEFAHNDIGLEKTSCLNCHKIHVENNTIIAQNLNKGCTDCHKFDNITNHVGFSKLHLLATPQMNFTHQKHVTDYFDDTYRDKYANCTQCHEVKSEQRKNIAR